MADDEYERLAERLTNPSVPLPAPRDVRTGGAAAEAGREFLISQFGSEAAVHNSLRRGRPRRGAPGGTSPTVRGRIPDADFAALKQLGLETGRTQSDLVREAIRLLLIAHRARI